jgi:hypothetical protein
MGTCTTRMKMMGFGCMGSKMVNKELLCQGCGLYDMYPLKELKYIFKNLWFCLSSNLMGI